MSYCHGQALLDRAADGRDYPEPYFNFGGGRQMVRGETPRQVRQQALLRPVETKTRLRIQPQPVKK